VRKLRALSEEELVAIPWLPDRVALALYDRLHGAPLGGRRPEEISKPPVGVSTLRGGNGAVEEA
jgi:hypothetical protein